MLPQIALQGTNPGDSLVGVGIAVFSILVFVAYYRSGEVLQGKLTALLHGTQE